MKVCVTGLWHQGTVIAACLAEGAHTVIGLDFDEATIAQLQRGIPPLFEPGLEESVKRGLTTHGLTFTTNPIEAVENAEVVWVAYDTPVDADDRADVEFVVERVVRLFPHLRADSLVLISSQLPVGTTRRLEYKYGQEFPAKSVSFGYSPENLRLGKAINVFTKPDRVVVGVKDHADRAKVTRLLLPFTQNIEWMTVESAEMTKHALNAFLAISITFINELAVICEAVGADAKQVERGLKSEARIGPGAYLSPGGPFAGGTLARDIIFLTQIGAAHGVSTHLFSAVRASNDTHKQWVQRKLLGLLEKLYGQTIAIWGLTYKSGTDTLRRSAAIELCHWLVGQGARVQVHDPAVRKLPEDLERLITLESSPLEAVKGAHALIVATEWQEYRAVLADEVVANMATAIVIDANRFLGPSLGADSRIRYAAVGKPEV
jgi:UDPglucose 6-dehydrogenase